MTHPFPHAVLPQTLHPREYATHENRGNRQLKTDLENLLDNRVHRIGEPHFPHCTARIPAVSVNRIDHSRGNAIADFAAFSEIQISLQLGSEEKNSKRNPRDNRDETRRPPQFGGNPENNEFPRVVQNASDGSSFEAVQSERWNTQPNNEKRKMGRNRGKQRFPSKLD